MTYVSYKEEAMYIARKRTVRIFQMAFLSFLVLMSAISSVFVPTAQAASDAFYVSSGGDDAQNPGTADAPFATIGKALEAVNSTGTIILLSDFILKESLVINVPGKTVTLRSLEGSIFSIKRDSTLINQHLIQINDGIITFQNLIIDGNQVEVGAQYDGVRVAKGTAMFENVEVINHIVKAGSQPAYVINSSSGGSKVILLEGTEVKNNKVTGRIDGNPPAVLGAGSGAVLQIDGGLITQNEVSAGSNGNIVSVGSYLSPRFQMTGGKITGNLLSGTELNDAGETIGNVAVYMRGTAAQARFDFGGAAYVYDNLNSDGDQRNVFLKNTNYRDSAYLTLISAMVSGARVGVYANKMPDSDAPEHMIVDIAKGYNGYVATLSDASYFVSDKSTDAAIAYDQANKKVVLTPVDLKVVHPWDQQIVGTLPTVNGEGTSGATVKVKLTSKANPSFVIEQDVTIQDDGTWSFTPGTELASGDYALEATLVKDGIITKPITVGFTVVDKAELEAELNRATDLNASDYTSLSWTKYQEEIAKAQEVFANHTATQAQVDAARIALQTAYDALMLVVSITEPAGETVIVAKPEFKGTSTPGSTVTLKIDGDEVDVHVDAEGNWSYTPDNDLPNGEHIVEVTATKDGKTNIATKTITVGTNSAVNKERLQAKVDEINAESLQEEDYTPETWTVLKEALEAAQYVLVDENATQEQVDAALQAVTDSRKALVRIVGLSIVPSAGTISPIVTDAVYDYTMSVGNSTSEIRLTVNFLPEATMTINGNPVEKGQASDAIFLGVGRNEITIVITEENGNTRTYTITVTRAASPSSGDSGGGNNNSGSGYAGSPSASPGPVTTTIEVDVVIGGDEEADITKVPIERTKNRNGSIADKVIFTKDKAQETVDKALKSGKDIARILIPDEADEVSQVNLEIPADTVNLLKGKGIALEIYNPNVFIQVPADSLNGLDQSFYFRLVPVKDRSEREDIELRAKTEEAVRKWAADGNIEVVARPMTIETNLPSRPVTLTLPLRGVALPEKAGERAAFLAQLGIFIEHTNGEKEVIPGNPVVMPDGQLGLQFSIDHFSTFTIIDFNRQVSADQHTPYVQGFPDGQFKPLEKVTRAQLAAMIARNLGYVEGSWSGGAPFKDVTATSWSAGVIAFVQERGIMQGMPDATFKPNQAVTRAEIATVMANYRELTAAQGGANGFTDIAEHWAQGSINAAYAAGLLEGFGDGSFKPNAPASRAEAVAMMNRMFERGPLYGVDRPSFPDVPASHWAFRHIEEAATTHSYITDEEQREVIADE